MNDGKVTLNLCFGHVFHDKKGPCHCWTPETKREREETELKIQEMNEELEPIMHEQWEITNGIQRMVLQNLPGRKPQWRWNQKHGKLT